MKLTYKNLIADMMALANPVKAKLLAGFFKTGPGQYGAGDVFLGVMVPQSRDVAKNYTSLALADLQKLLNSKIHEIRLAALFVLLKKYQLVEDSKREVIIKFYLKNSKNINNWDLVDLSAPKILGDYLLTRPRQILDELSKSESLWERRIAVLATFAFIKNNDFADALRLAKSLINDKHDLMHKAVGWMLREIGKREKKVLLNFLNLNYKKMPRTMLRYAIEKFTAAERAKYLKK